MYGNPLKGFSNRFFHHLVALSSKLGLSCLSWVNYGKLRIKADSKSGYLYNPFYEGPLVPQNPAQHSEDVGKDCAW